MSSGKWRPFCLSLNMLTHWGRERMAAISQTTFSNAFSWMKIYEFRLKFHWSLFPRVQLTIFQHWFRQWLGADQATSHYLNQWWLDYQRIYASLGLNELMHKQLQMHCCIIRTLATYRLVSNIRRTSNIRHTPTLGNSQLEFSRTISLAKTSNTRRTPSFDFWVSIVDKVRSWPTWSELLRVAWDFDSLWIKGPMTPYQSRPYARHVAVIPAAKLCDSIAIVFLSIEVRIQHNLRRYIDGSAILFWLSRDPYDPDDQRFHHASRRKLCGIKRYFDKITSVCDKLSILNYIFQA